MKKKNQFLTKAANYFFVSFILVASILASCKNDDEPSIDYKISFKVDDVLEEFTSENSPSGNLLDGNLPNRLSIFAEKPSAVISLTVFDMKAIIETTYNGLVVKQSNTQYSIVGAEVGYQKNKANYASERFPSSDVSITITEMTSKTVRGKFSAKVYGAAQGEIVITDGEFFVPLDISNN